MRKLFFPKLAASNLRKNGKIYFPFILTCIGTVAMFYIICSLVNNKGITSVSLLTVLKLAVQVTAVFVVIFLFYTNSFLMKGRKIELGLYNVLGMDKKHIAITVLCETVIIAAVSLVLGFAAGIALDKLMFLTLLKIVNIEITLGFQISLAAMLLTLKLFGVVFLLILLDSFRQIYFSKPIELLKGGQVGEREPKTKWLMTIIGVLSLGSGYYIAITTKNPISAINMFFIAVILVMIGTYSLFTSGSIVLLKLLRNNKEYYYKTKHFISVSSMMYRMKQNAAGLGNICILSTAVLVMISTTLSLYVGLEDVLQTRYPQSIILEAHDDYGEKIYSDPDTLLKEKKLTPKNEVRFSYLSFATIVNGSEFITDFENSLTAYINNVRVLVFIPLDDYNSMVKESKTLEEGEIFIYTNRGGYNYDTLQVLDESFSVKETLKDIPCGDLEASNISISHYIIVKDMEIIEKAQKTLSVSVKEDWMIPSIWQRYAFDLDVDSETTISVSESIQNMLKESGVTYKAECRDSEYKDFMGIYGGLFFIGIFLGFLFIMATVLIIYYKQITEGYSDKERFVIMKNVGLSGTEIKNAVRSQILTVFFLPLVTAGLHITAAFPFLTQILKILNLTNIWLFVICTFVCYGVFAVFYTLIYSLTARTYYRIVG